MNPTTPKTHLFTLATPSDATNRLHIALRLKVLAYNHSEITLPPTQEYLKLNPSGTAPTLVLPLESSDLGAAVLSQSIAALEYLEEAFPETNPLLPPLTALAARGQVRTLMNIITADTHPLTTNRVQKSITSLFPGEAAEKAKRSGNREWDVHWIRRGLGIFEESLFDAGDLATGNYSVGDNVTLADVCLVPEVWTAERMGVRVANEFPRIAKVVSRCMELPAFAEARAIHGS